MPLTDSDSCTSEEMSAIAPWRVAAIARRRLPTRRATPTKNGRTASEKTASRQSSRNIATTVASTVVTLEAIDVAVVVTTVCTPPMSLAMRDWISPGARAREERERQALQVPVDGGAQVVHDALADDVGQVGLPDAERAGGDR